MVGSGVGVAANDWSDWRAPLTASSSSLMVPTSAEWWLVNESFVFCLRLVNRFERSDTEPSGRELSDLRIDVSASGGLDLRPRDRSHKARTVDDVRAAIFCSNHLLRAASKQSSTGDVCLPQLAADLIYLLSGGRKGRWRPFDCARAVPGCCSPADLGEARIACPGRAVDGPDALWPHLVGPACHGGFGAALS